MYYVYIYFDHNRVPYYVGEGTRLRYLDRHRVPVPKFILVLSEDATGKPITQQDAFALEWLLVTSIARKDLGKGPLLNLTDGKAGISNVTAPSRAKMLEGWKRGSKIAGPLVGKIAVENGQFSRMVTKESCAKGAQAVNHKRWHVGKGVVKPGCPLCLPPSTKL